MKKIWNCALTGHRDLPPDFDEEGLYQRLEEIAEKGCDTFLCGMAMGYDLHALRCLVELKKKYNFTIEACIPYRGHERGFPPEEKALFYELVKKCDQTTVVFEKYQEGCFFARDRYMVDCADVVLAYCKRKTGGTAYTVNYAMKTGKPVIFLQ